MGDSDSGVGVMPGVDSIFCKFGVGVGTGVKHFVIAGVRTGVRVKHFLIIGVATGVGVKVLAWSQSRSRSHTIFPKRNAGSGVGNWSRSQSQSHKSFGSWSRCRNWSHDVALESESEPGLTGVAHL